MRAIARCGPEASLAIQVGIHNHQPDAVVTITPEDTLRAALNQRLLLLGEL